jgi:hypothetical protein
MKLARIAAPVLALALLDASAVLAQAGPKAAPAARWDAPPPAFGKLQIQGYRAGLAGARRDIATHHRPDVNNRPEFSHPAVPAADRDAYREAYRQGYNTGIQHALGGGEDRLQS